MPRTRKHYKWKVNFNGKEDIVISKTYKGACHKFLRKYKFSPPDFNYWTGRFNFMKAERLT